MVLRWSKTWPKIRNVPSYLTHHPLRAAEMVGSTSRGIGERNGYAGLTQRFKLLQSCRSAPIVPRVRIAPTHRALARQTESAMVRRA